MVASPEMNVSDFVTHYYSRDFKSRATPEDTPLPLQLSRDVSEWLYRGFNNNVLRTRVNTKSIEVTTSLGMNGKGILEKFFKFGSSLRNTPSLLIVRKGFYFLHPDNNGRISLSCVNSFPIRRLKNGDLKLINYNGLGGATCFIGSPDDIIVLPPQEV